MYAGLSSRTDFVSVVALLALLSGGCESESAVETAAAGSESFDANGETQTSVGENPASVADIAPARPVISETMAYAELKNELVYGYFSVPA